MKLSEDQELALVMCAGTREVRGGVSRAVEACPSLVELGFLRCAPDHWFGYAITDAGRDFLVAREGDAHERRMLGACGCGVCLLVRKLRKDGVR